MLARTSRTGPEEYFVVSSSRFRASTECTERAILERHQDIANLLVSVHQTQQRVEEQKIVIETRDPTQRIWILSAAPLGKTPSGARLAIAMTIDVTESEPLTEKLTHESTHDSLTGLVNRHEFELRLGRALDSARRDGIEHALCYLDLDNFKRINGICGDAAATRCCGNFPPCYAER